MATELSRIDRLTKTYALADYFPGGVPSGVTAVSVALLSPRSTPTGSTVWFLADSTADAFTVLLAGPDTDSTGALVVPASADLWVKVAATPQVDAQKVERVTVLGGGSLANPQQFASIQSLIGLDTDGVPFYDPSGIGIPASLSLDTDGVLYFTP